jgi:hypothetical protein
MLFTISKSPGQPIIFILILLILLLSCSPARAQIFSYGLSVGVPLTNLATADNDRSATTRRYSFGPSLRIALPHGFALDVDLLYKRLDLGTASNAARIRAHRLELVPLLEYALMQSPIRPFVRAGMSFNRVIAGGGSDACTDSLQENNGYYCIGDEVVAQLRHSHTHGFVLGSGVDFRLRALHLEPELRITRWVDRNFGTQDSSLRSNLTQIELLLGFLF